MTFRHRLNPRPRRRAAFTLVELLISSGIVVVVGGLVFACLLAGLQLFGKNLAANLPFHGSRLAYDFLQRDLHTALAEPALLDAALHDVPGAGPAAGVALRWLVAGPCLVTADTAASALTLEVEKGAGSEAPKPGDLLSLPAFRIERTITSVASVGAHWQLGLEAPLGTPLVGAATENFVCLVSRRCGYVVSGEMLLCYSDLGDTANSRVVTRGVTNPTPFSFPVNGGQPDRRYLATQLVARDPGSSQRGWRGLGANLHFTIALRATSPLTTR
jgi:hypothetical protein